MQTTKFIQSSHEHDQLSDPVCDSVNRELTLVRLRKSYIDYLFKIFNLEVILS